MVNPKFHPPLIHETEKRRGEGKGDNKEEETIRVECDETGRVDLLPFSADVSG